MNKSPFLFYDSLWVRRFNDKFYRFSNREYNEHGRWTVILRSGILNALAIFLPSWRFFDRPGFEAWVEWRSSLEITKAPSSWQPLMRPIDFRWWHFIANEQAGLRHLLQSMIDRVVIEISDRTNEPIESMKRSERLKLLSKAVSYFIREHVFQFYDESREKTELQTQSKREILYDWRICIKTEEANQVVFETHGQTLNLMNDLNLTSRKV